MRFLFLFLGCIDMAEVTTVESVNLWFIEKKDVLTKYNVVIEHIQLTPYSVMTVKYAAQVLSKTVSVALQKFGGESTTETATFCTHGFLL